jgi:alkylation response protein AidB-like acyl-CoA dehydrogenase
MEFELSEEQKAQRKVWDDFYREMAKDAPKNWRGIFGNDTDSTYGNGYEDSIAEWAKKVTDAEYERGYLNISWPREYGGQEMNPIDQMIMNEVKTYYHPVSGNWAGISLLAPSIMMFSTEEQKKEFLPKILTGEMMFVQAWSEPNAGSDLASLTTRAVRDGDYYIVNGQKTWISGTQRADWGHSPFRTDPDASKRHRGLSYFIYPLDTPGITVRPVNDLANRYMWGEIFYEDVRIPAEYMIGEENRGWYVTMATANSERSGASFGAHQRTIEELLDFCIKTERDGRRLIDDPFVRDGLVDLFIDNAGIRALCYRSAWEQSKGEDVTKYASAVKIRSTEWLHRMSAFVCHQVGGLYGQMRVGSKWTLFDGVYESLWENDLGQPINVGHNDIQHNVIANWGLHLPRE